MIEQREIESKFENIMAQAKDAMGMDLRGISDQEEREMALKILMSKLSGIGCEVLIAKSMIKEELTELHEDDALSSEYAITA
jgi:hypothetical protein